MYRALTVTDKDNEENETEIKSLKINVNSAPAKQHVPSLLLLVALCNHIFHKVYFSTQDLKHSRTKYVCWREYMDYINCNLPKKD